MAKDSHFGRFAWGANRNGLAGCVCAGLFTGLFCYYATSLVVGVYASFQYWVLGDAEPLLVGAILGGPVMTVFIIAKGGWVSIPVALVVAVLNRPGASVPGPRLVARDAKSKEEDQTA